MPPLLRAVRPPSIRLEHAASLIIGDRSEAPFNDLTLNSTSTMHPLRLIGDKVLISVGLEGQDNNFDTLSRLWEQLQASAYEPASQPEADVVSFAQGCVLFGVISKKFEPEQSKVTSDIMAESNPFNVVKPEPEKTKALFQNEWDEVKRGGVASSNGTGGGFRDAASFMQWWTSRVASTSTNETEVTQKLEERKMVSLDMEDLSAVWKTAQSSKNTAADKEASSPRPAEAENSQLKHDPPAMPLRIVIPPTKPKDVALKDIPSRSITEATAASGSQSWATHSTNWPTIDPGFKFNAERVFMDRHPVPTDVLGVVYLIASPFGMAPAGQLPELNLGVVIDERNQSNGYATEAVRLVVAEAFENLRAHRIQATLIGGGHTARDSMTSILARTWFSHEGISRRAFYNPLLHEWQDVARFGIVDTDWAMRGFWKPAPRTLWDELLERHERERAELLRWDEDKGLPRVVKKSTSLETLRARVRPRAGADDAADRDAPDVQVGGYCSSSMEDQESDGEAAARDSTSWGRIKAHFGSSSHDSDTESAGPSAPMRAFRRRARSDSMSEGSSVESSSPPGSSSSESWEDLGEVDSSSSGEWESASERGL
ncbi:hypothetical protein HMN09_00945500 [Mycena chlorophos]|uniref:N-acetyltransferase domain-containing protein n=1 Tax=Mycena chlorophos TaxID=658473 RepID=A0A8H6W3Q6_MYCCL|nr:hypothetical protein HMN09_00945500 [Mycena chlorophos]